MEKYIVIVRDYDYNRPTDDYLDAMDSYYKSPVVELDYLKDMDKAMNVFDSIFRKHFSHFRHLHYQLIPQ